jgi:hypothetical protein
MEKKDRWNPAIAVKISEVSRQRSVERQRKVVAENSADLSTRMMGYVTKVYVQIGKVSVGQTLVSINNSDLKAKKRQMLLFFRQPRDTTMPRKITIVLWLYSSNKVPPKEWMIWPLVMKWPKGLEKQNKWSFAQFNYSTITAPFSEW